MKLQILLYAQDQVELVLTLPWPTIGLVQKRRFTVSGKYRGHSIDADSMAEPIKFQILNFYFRAWGDSAYFYPHAAKSLEEAGITGIDPTEIIDIIGKSNISPSLSSEIHPHP